MHLAYYDVSFRYVMNITFFGILQIGYWCYDIGIKAKQTQGQEAMYE